MSGSSFGSLVEPGPSHHHGSSLIARRRCTEMARRRPPRACAVAEVDSVRRFDPSTRANRGAHGAAARARRPAARNHQICAEQAKFVRQLFPHVELEIQEPAITVAPLVTATSATARRPRFPRSNFQSTRPNITRPAGSARDQNAPPAARESSRRRAPPAPPAQERLAKERFAEMPVRQRRLLRENGQCPCQR